MCIKKKKKKALVLIISILGVIIFLIGAFFLGRVLAKDKSPEKIKENDRKEGKFDYKLSFREGNINYHVFDGIIRDLPKKDWKVIYVSENHPEIKRLLREGKLQEKKQFIIRYGKADKEEINLYLTFNENNRELEIKEI